MNKLIKLKSLANYFQQIDDVFLIDWMSVNFIFTLHASL